MVRKSVVILLVALLSVGSASLRAQDKNAMSVYKVARFIQYLSNDYVDTINTSKIVEKAIVDMLGQLDPHSFYISREDVQAANEPLEGNFEGVGVEFNILHDTLIVVNPVPAGPSERAGIIAGDRIISVDGKVIAGIGLKNSDVFKLLRGPKGTKVVVTVLRRGLANNLEFTITRDKIPILSLDASYMLAPKIGYVKLNRFALTSEEEFVSALLELQKEGMKDLVLDLRGNGGGYLNAAVAMADHFFEKNNLLVFTEGRNNPRTDYVSSPGGLFTKGKVIVLIDEGSASASEILAGAIQDWDRGIVIGRRSFGKGLVQNQMPLPDGSMIRLTVAR
ncbi:MAG TPA: S41 family peptidase, partial [Tenuifilaceae bacterium]|nr:S41 family peptidase [Tenuifilaceae bacterium]